MRSKLVMLTAGLAVLASAAANAQLSISNVTPSTNVYYVPGTTTSLLFSGDITNNGSSTVESAHASVGALPSGVSGTPTDNFTLNFGPLAPGGVYSGELFSLLIDPTCNCDFFQPLFTVTGLDANGDPIGDSVGRLTINVQAVPEPGTVAMLVGGLVGGGMLAMRRRRN